MTNDVFIEIKKQINESFQGIQDGVNDTIEQTDVFIKMISPYVDYFFAGKTDDNSFIGDVVFPSRRDLAEAMLGATGIMEGDAQVHDTVSTAVSQVLKIRDNISEIVGMLESIEIYSLNTMVISGKSGEVGQALATISAKMAQLSRNGNQLSEMVQEKMGKMTESLQVFSNMRNIIEGLHENNLTMISLSSSGLFKGLLEEFNTLSDEVMNEYGMIRSMNDSLKRITGKFQHEDLVRQGLEKIQYMEELKESQDSREFADNTGIDENRAMDLFSALLGMKTADVRLYIHTLHDELDAALRDVNSVMDLFSSSNISGSDSKTSGVMLDKLYENLETLKGRFTEYIDAILKQKEEMQEFLRNLSLSIDEFSSFFSGITDISKTFKTIILLTQIELSRHDTLKSLLAGSLSDVKKIPDRINRIVSRGVKEYETIKTSLHDALEMYRQRYSEQRVVLEQSAQLIRNISVQVFESKKYHSVCLQEITDIMSNVQSLINKSRGNLQEFMNASESLKNGSGTPMDRHTLIEKFGDELNTLYDYYSGPERATDYRSMMIASISSEYREKASESGTIEFF